MGGLFKSNILCVKEYETIKNKIDNFTIIGTFLDEKHDFKYEGIDKVMLLLGNEANGLNNSLKADMDYNYRISNKTDFESLNVSIAAGIIMDRIFNLNN